MVLTFVRHSYDILRLIMVNDKERSGSSSIEQISPVVLAAFLSRQTGKDFPQSNYPEIFLLLKFLLPQEQKKLLVSYFSEKVNVFPNGRELGEAMARINNIPWFIPEQEPEPNILRQFATTFLERLSPRKYLNSLIIMKDWTQARRMEQRVDGTSPQNETGEKAIKEAYQASRDANLTVAWKEAGYQAGQAALYQKSREIQVITTQAAARMAQWTVVQDLMPSRGFSGNPFEALIGIYELGCWPIGAVSVKDEKVDFAVFVPPSV